MPSTVDVPPSSSWKQALHLLEEAQTILDESDAPGDVGCHLDMALKRLEACLGARETSSPNIFAELDQALREVMQQPAREVAVW
jgi:hypothetical protein